MDYRTNKAWQRADDLAVLVYELTKGFPREELYGLTSQIRRAAVSAATNIAEGSGRRTAKDYLHFLYMARGSLMEVEYYIHLAQRLGYLSDEEHRGLEDSQGEAARTLKGLIGYWEKEVEAQGKEPRT
jgi:four helix bundle protein